MTYLRLKALTETVLDSCLDLVTPTSEGPRFTDPLEKKEIIGHYGGTHAAASFCLLAGILERPELFDTGTAVLNGILDRWESSARQADFHNDFNLFALTLACRCLMETGRDPQTAERIRRAVINTADSPHDTVNWLPMRIMVNRFRYDCTARAGYLETCKRLQAKMTRAVRPDGFIEDRLPAGKSFSLQYDVSSAALVQLMQAQNSRIDLKKILGAVLYAAAPDGDINYLGRGTNQVFAWGPYLYLLSSAGREEEMKKALDYCEGRIGVMLKKHNLMLNDLDGEWRYLWWDYHYFSVYAAHLLLWLTLALRDHGKYPVVPETVRDGSSGLTCLRQDGWFAAVFSGRSEYLAERGPQVAALGTMDGKMLFKGPFGPSDEAFGSLYSLPLPVLMNTLGVMEIRQSPLRGGGKLTGKIGARLTDASLLRLRPAFLAPEVHSDAGGISISFVSNRLIRGFLNVPVSADRAGIFRLTAEADGRCAVLKETGSIMTQYGSRILLQSSPCNGKTWTLRIEKEGGL